MRINGEKKVTKIMQRDASSTVKGWSDREAQVMQLDVIPQKARRIVGRRIVFHIFHILK